MKGLGLILGRKWWILCILYLNGARGDFNTNNLSNGKSLWEFLLHRDNQGMLRCHMTDAVFFRKGQTCLRDSQVMATRKAKLAGRPLTLCPACPCAFFLCPYSKMSQRKCFDNRAEGRDRNFSELSSDLKSIWKRAKGCRGSLLHCAHKAFLTANVSDSQKSRNCHAYYTCLCCFKMKGLSLNLVLVKLRRMCG